MIYDDVYDRWRIPGSGVIMVYCTLRIEFDTSLCALYMLAVFTYYKWDMVIH